MSSPAEQKVADAIAALGARELGLRREALARLCEMAMDSSMREAVAPHLVRLTKDRDPEVRSVVCSGIGRGLAPAEALRVLSECAEDADPRVRAFAVRSAAENCGPEVRALLAKALDDSDFAVRFEAALGMTMLGHGAGYDVLVAALSREPYRFDALAALFRLGDERALPSVRKLLHRFFLPPFERTQAAGTLARLGDPEGRTYLLERIEARRAMDRGLAIELCGEVGIHEARPCLFRTLADRKDQFRGAAARALGALKCPDALQVLETVLGDEGDDPDVRMDAVDGLLRLESPEARAALRASADSAIDADVRTAAAEALEQMRESGQ
jgi:HEAT repeat protein